uniref:polyamine-transporting ATPase 13A2 n=1 Tax=Euleptes europaea TaxID=460621 RepID=UPI00253FAEF3|nr:polyamine-transporting ATPase 13A2 [Euleptes europaea]
MATKGSMEAFDTANPSEWESYADCVAFFLDANDVTDASKKRLLFFSVCGPRTFQLAQSLLAPAKLSDTPFDDIMAALGNHFATQPTQLARRLAFLLRDQEPGESVTSYLCQTSRFCTFPDLDGTLRDWFVFGLRREKVRCRLVAKKDVSRTAAIEEATAAEASTADKCVSSCFGHPFQGGFVGAWTFSLQADPVMSSGGRAGPGVASLRHVCWPRIESKSRLDAAQGLSFHRWCALVQASLVAVPALNSTAGTNPLHDYSEVNPTECSGVSSKVAHGLLWEAPSESMPLAFYEDWAGVIRSFSLQASEDCWSAHPGATGPSGKAFLSPAWLDVSGYQSKTWKVILCHLLSLLTLGSLLVIFHWKPHLKVRARCSRCPLRQADWVVITDQFGQYFTARVQTEQVEGGSLSLCPAAGKSSVAVGVAEDPDARDTIRLHQEEEEEEKDAIRFYLFEGLRYIWIEKWEAFCRVSKLDENRTFAAIHSSRCGLSAKERSTRRKVYGPNLIDVAVKSYLSLLIAEVLNPFYIFQVFSMSLWICESYYYYAACIFVISAVSIGISLYETRKQSETLQSMVKMSISVRVCTANGEETTMNSSDLVPGDCIVVPADGMFVPCDVALLSGECMVNESLLTGESTPVMKTPLPEGLLAASTIYSPEEHRRHTLFCGTQVLQARSYVGADVLAVVTRTGFCTAKGDLISSILYPKPVNFKFYKDAVKFVLFLAVLAALGTAYSIFILIRNRVPAWQIVLRGLDIVTVVVPPALPAAMTVGTIYAQNRLKKHGIFCISPPQINLCGKLRLICFDKTGTLTEEGLDIWGVVPRENRSFLPIVHEVRCVGDGPLLRCLVTCHTVSLLRDQPVGDPVDLKMLESTGWTQETVEGAEAEAQVLQLFGSKALVVMKPPPLADQPSNAHMAPVAVLRRFPFASSLQRMSVLVKLPGGSPSEAYMKGAPEMVASRCKQESVPVDFCEMLRHYTSNGFRVLGLSYKPLTAIRTFEEAQAVPRDSVEGGMLFLGFLMMKNVLKPETAPVIHLLHNAEIRTVMVTGDNMLTAVNVAKSCRMVEAGEQVVFVNAVPPSDGQPSALKFVPAEPPPQQLEGSYQQESYFLERHPSHFALNGKSFAVVCEHFPDLLPKILVRATIFARMSPDQKTLLIRCLQDLSYCVGMCGDGANDCGALKAADVGISLSEAEASVASPFTSKIASIESVPIVIREGRCSLVTSFVVFKYMALYSLVQFVSVLLLYTINTNLSDLQFFFFDLVITTTVAALMGKTAPAQELGPERPQGTLMNPVVLGSLLLQTGLFIAIQVVCYFITVSQRWYVPLNSTVTAPENLPNYENTVVFCISGFQYLTLAVAMSKGYPFRKPLYSNVFFFIALLVLFGLMVWLTLYPLGFMNLLSLKGIADMNFKLALLGLATLHFFMAFVLETFLDHGLLGGLRRLRRKKASKKIFKRLENELRQQQPLWPPLYEPLFAPATSSIVAR